MKGERDPFNDAPWRVVADYLPAVIIGLFLVAILAPWFPFIGAAAGALVILAVIRFVNRSSAKRPLDPP